MQQAAHISVTTALPAATLLGLILGEKLMGIPGMILAPVILHYIKLETAQIEVKAPDEGLIQVSR